MIRSRTTLIVGAGASCEIQLPSNEELLARIGQSFDFSRFGTGTQTKDSSLLAQYLKKTATRLGKGDEEIYGAAERLNIASRLARSIDGILEQHDTDPMILASGKIAIAHFICQAEAKSILRLEPRIPGDLPIQGADTWLYQLGQLVTSSVPRSKVEQSLDSLSIVNFNYDRSIEHFLPYALVVAFGMALEEAQQIVSAKLEIIHPYGTVGRLPWQEGDSPDCQWGTEQPANIHDLADQIRTSAEVMGDAQLLQQIRENVSSAKRLVFLGFGFQPQNVDILLDCSPSHDTELLATVYGLSQTNQIAVGKMLKRKTGIEADEQTVIMNAKCIDVMRDYSMVLES